MEKSKSKNILIILFALVMIVIGAFFLGGCGEEQNTIPTVPGTSDEVVQYLKEQLSETQKQLTDANILLQSYLKQIEEANKNNATLGEQNQTLNETIQTLQENVKSLNAEVQRLTALLEEYGKIADGTWEVHFYDGESLVKLLLIRNNSKITETVMAEKEGFEFLGWASEEGGQVVDYQNIEITQVTNFYAVFERISGLFNIEGVRVKTWDELVNQGEITLNESTLTKANTSLSGRLVVPDKITKIGMYAFQDCDKLTAVDCYGVTYLGYTPFLRCNRLREVNYNQDSIYFEDIAFQSCPNLRKIVLPKKTEFSGSSYPSSVDLLTGLIEVINNSSFSEEELKKAFSFSSSSLELLGHIHTGESRIKTIEGVDYYIYNDNTVALAADFKRENVKLIDECNMIWDGAFSYQDQLKNVALSENLSAIKDSTAFSYCQALETVWMPFQIVYDGKYPSYNFLGCNKENITIYFDKETLKSYEQDRLNNFLQSTKSDSYPTPVSKYVLGTSRSDYLTKFKF